MYRSTGEYVSGGGGGERRVDLTDNNNQSSLEGIFPLGNMYRGGGRKEG